MKVILLRSIKGLGQAGAIKEVKDGFGRNYLIPRGLADILNKHGLEVKQAQKKKQERLKAKGQRNKVKLAKRINGKVFEINVKADDKGTIYAKISKKIIRQTLLEQGYEISDKEIILEEPIKKIGEYDVELNLGGEKAMIKIVINKISK